MSSGERPANCLKFLLLWGFSVPVVYAFEIQDHSWPDATATFYVGITTAPGDPNWNTTFESAMAKWNAVTPFTYLSVRDSPADPCNDPNTSEPKNGVDFSDTNCGTAFGSTVLAIEKSRTKNGGTVFRQSGIIFNGTKTWDVYSGPWIFGTADFRRVAIHELGHSIGMGHEENNPAIMSPFADDDEIPQQDDIDGAVFIYGDADGDVIRNNVDNCRDIANPGQNDLDGDGLGDACDDDDDGDGIPDNQDNDDQDGDGVLDTPITDQEQTELDPDDKNSGIGDVSPENTPQLIAQVVTVGRAGFLTQIRVPIACRDGDLTIDIQGVQNDEPDGIALASETFSASSLPYPQIFRSLWFSNPISFALGERFAIVLKSTGFCSIRQSASSNAYSGGRGYFTNAGITDGSWVFTFDWPFQTSVPNDNCPTVSNPSQSDTDNDGAGDDCDNDDDSDGVADTMDNCPLVPNAGQANADSDPFGDACDTDDDNDGVLDAQDAFPFDPSESADSDGDGTGDNADTDDDNDGVLDTQDAFPFDPSESADSDGDGTGDNADTDDDNDGVLDTQDAFPFDPNESVDSDGDGTGDNADDLPLDPTEQIDSDGDGIGNNADIDDDNDNVPDAQDAFPLNPNESVDTDGDGVGNNADDDDDNDGMTDTYETENNFDALNPADASEDADGDGFTNLREFRGGTNPRDPNSKPNVSMPWLSLLLDTDDPKPEPPTVTIVTLSTSQSQFDSGTDNQGWWSATSPNSDHNDNYITGGINNNLRCFFTFDTSQLPGGLGQLINARLDLRRYQSGQTNEAVETLEFFDVSTDAAVLNNNVGPNPAIHSDLGTGTSYGSFDVPGGDPNPDVILSFKLNASALADISAAAGGYFSIGAVLVSQDGDDYLFSGSGDLGIQDLVLTFSGSP